MHLLMANCPYCHAEVETTMERIDEPIECPTCGKPFEMEMPSVEVSQVRDVDPGSREKFHSIADEAPEQVLLKTHPAVFRSHPFVTMALLALVGLGVFGAVQGWLSGQLQIAYISLAGLAVLLVAVLVWWVRAIFVTLTVTNQRTILQKGLISRSTSEVQHTDVKNIQLEQSILERVFRVGDIGISSSGQDELEIVAVDIPNPTRVVEIVRSNQNN